MGSRFIAIGVLGLAIIIGGFILWPAFLCPTCQAAERKLLRTERRLEQIPKQALYKAGGEVQASPQVGSPAPYFVLEDLEGREVSLSDFADKNVLLVFWATYCGWCAKEKGDLVRFTNEQKGEIEVVAIDNESFEIVLDYVSKERINFMVLLDEGRKTFEKYQVLGTPDHFLINREGKIVARRPGYAGYADLLMLTQALEKE